MRESVLSSHFCQCARRTESACVHFPEKLEGYKPEVSNFLELGKVLAQPLRKRPAAGHCAVQNTKLLLAAT